MVGRQGFVARLHSSTKLDPRGLQGTRDPIGLKPGRWADIFPAGFGIPATSRYAGAIGPGRQADVAGTAMDARNAADRQRPYFGRRTVRSGAAEGGFEPRAD